MAGQTEQHKCQKLSVRRMHARTHTHTHKLPARQTKTTLPLRTEGGRGDRRPLKETGLHDNARVLLQGEKGIHTQLCILIPPGYTTTVNSSQNS
eukprot:1158265-Pelagomonas_calceolata.AAC.4